MEFVWHGAREEGVCWKCFSPLRRRCVNGSDTDGRDAMATAGRHCAMAWHSSIAASFFFISFTLRSLDIIDNTSITSHIESSPPPLLLSGSLSLSISSLSQWSCQFVTHTTGQSNRGYQSRELVAIPGKTTETGRRRFATTYEPLRQRGGPHG